MLKHRAAILTFGAVLGLIGLQTLPSAAEPQKVTKAEPKQERTLALGQDEVKQLILLMDADKNGRISKKEFMDFMAAEFDRLDKDKSGELDQKELALSQIRPARPAVGK
jgi:EF hand